MSLVPSVLILVLVITFFGGVISYTAEYLDKTDYMNDNQDFLDYWKSDIPKKASDLEGITDISK